MRPNLCKNPCCSIESVPVPSALLAEMLGHASFGMTGIAICSDCMTGVVLTVEGFGLGFGFMNANSEPSFFLFCSLSFLFFTSWHTSDPKCLLMRFGKPTLPRLTVSPQMGQIAQERSVATIIWPFVSAQCLPNPSFWLTVDGSTSTTTFDFFPFTEIICGLRE